MKKMLIAVAALFSAGVCAEAASQVVPKPGDINGEGRRLVWHDEFDGDRLDTVRWKRCTRWNVDWCRYMSRRSDLVEVRDGLLVMKGVANSDTNKDARPYLTGGIQSASNAFLRLGKAEIRAKFENQKGAWPALWMCGRDKDAQGRGWPWNGEIDIVERLNSDPFVHQTIHTGWIRVLKQKKIPTSAKAPIRQGEWNVYGIEITENDVIWTVNGKETFRYPRVQPPGSDQWPFDRDMFFIMDMQLGGSWVGEIDPKTLPVNMYIDWIRVWGPAKKPAEGADIRGAFPLLSTPYAADGSLDCETLAKEAEFVAECGVQGIIWPPAGESLKLLTPDEERRGWEAIAGALDGRNAWFAPCCPGRNVDDMLRRVADVEKIAEKHPGLKTTMLVRMVDDAKTDADYTRQYDALAARTKLPVIIQTYNGLSPMPSADCLIDLARRHPGPYGWFKVEGTGAGIVPCMRALVAAKPVVKTVFTGWGGRDWLYHYRRIGTRGVITQRPMYADLIMRIWRALEAGDPEADALFAKFMYLRNLEDVIPAPQMRGWNLYVLKKRGVFPNMLSRVAKKDGGWELKDVTLSDIEIAEIEARLKYAIGE